MQAANYPDLVEHYSTLALAFNADTEFEALVIISKFGIRFELFKDKDFEPFRAAYVKPDDDFDAAMNKYVELVDLLDYQKPEDFELKEQDLHESMRLHYQKFGTKGEL